MLHCMKLLKMKGGYVTLSIPLIWVSERNYVFIIYSRLVDHINFNDYSYLIFDTANNHSKLLG